MIISKACGIYYPGSDKVWDGFAKAYPGADIIKPENGRFDHGKYMVITGAQEESYSSLRDGWNQITDRTDKGAVIYFRSRGKLEGGCLPKDVIPYLPTASIGGP